VTEARTGPGSASSAANSRSRVSSGGCPTVSRFNRSATVSARSALRNVARASTVSPPPWSTTANTRWVLAVCYGRKP
jgi:hypothetical protein